MVLLAKCVVVAAGLCRDIASWDTKRPIRRDPEPQPVRRVRLRDARGRFATAA
jgi:hypothetical protein